ncbi:MAG: lysylphosphatidylglycerol synthase transmembrane domain-containing protein, partial [bacterium]
MRKGIGAALRFAVGFAALGLLITRMDPARAWAVVASADPGWLFAALAAQLAGKAFWVLRWGTLLASTGHRRGAGELLRWILVGLFFNNFLPTSVGGDVARGLGIARGGVPRATAAASVVGDRLIGL